MSLAVVDVLHIPTSGPGDVSGLVAQIESGRLEPGDIVAVIGKTEGNGGVNDFTREYAVAALAAALAPRLGLATSEVEQKIAFVMSGGTEGILSPHITVFARHRTSPNARSIDKRLSIGIARTRGFAPEEIGRQPQIEETRYAVTLAMADAGISDPADVHFVQVKCPLLTSERIERCLGHGRSPVTTLPYESMAYSRGASALGVAAALGEVSPSVNERAVLENLELYSSVASTSSGVELTHNVVVVMGNATGSVSPFIIGHAVMRDPIDGMAVRLALTSVGLGTCLDGEREDDPLLVNVFAKAEPTPDGLVRGFRHTMLQDTDISATRHARAAVGGLIAGLTGRNSIYVSGGAEHQGPPGGGPVAVIARA